MFLNVPCQEFYYVTKKMEGDNSSACLMISEYRKIISFIRKKLAISAEPKFKTMLQRMLEKTQTYLNESMGCDAVLVATVLNPSFRLSIFQVLFPDQYDYTFSLIKGLFEAKVIEVQEASASLLEKSATPAEKQSSNKAKQEEVDYFPEAVAAPVFDELSIYLEGKHKLPTSQASQCLEWWKVCHFLSYQKLLSIVELIFIILYIGTCQRISNTGAYGQGLLGVLFHLCKC
jgi:hypothetical protein